MSGLTFRLDSFEGPLDLLLHLISKHKLNIYDIEISLLLEQYLEYIDAAGETDLELAGDFLAMAARLVYIKTCSLLPHPEEAEELKRELSADLIEYSVCKQAASRLRELCIFGDVFVRPPEKLPVNKTFTGKIDPSKLVEAYMGMSAKTRSARPVRAERFTPLVATRFVTVTSKILFVLKKLYRCGECAVSELYEGVSDKSARVATFLAVLELTKSGRICLNEDNTLISFNKSSKRRHQKHMTPQQLLSEAEVLAADIDPEPSEPQEDTPPQPQPEADMQPEPEPDLEPEPEPEILSEPVDISAADRYLAERMSADTRIIFTNQDTADSEQAAKKSAAKPKENRFSRRFLWGFAEPDGNCWRYERECALWR